MRATAGLSVRRSVGSLGSLSARWLLHQGWPCNGTMTPVSTMVSYIFTNSISK